MDRLTHILYPDEKKNANEDNKELCSKDIHPQIRTQQEYNLTLHKASEDFKKRKLIYDNIKRNISQRNCERREIFKILHPKKLKEISKEELDTKWKEITGMKRTNKSTIYFDFSDKRYLNALSYLSDYKIPKVDQYSFYKIPEDSEELSSFMVNSIVKDQFDVTFNWNSQVTLDCSRYFFSLRDVASKCVNIFKLDHMRISTAEFCSIVSAAKNSYYLEFYSCTLLTDSECDFGKMKRCLIKVLDFSMSGHPRYSNWVENKDRLINIVKGILKCRNFKKAVESMYVTKGLSKCYGSDLIKEIEDRVGKAKKIQIA